MGKINYNKLSFVDHYVESRKLKDGFFRQIDKILDWDKISNILDEYYPKGRSVSGRKSYPSILLFKMSLLQTWYGLSDYAIEEQVNDRITFMRFCGLKFEDKVPDHSIICRFRKFLVKNGGYEKILDMINTQLSNHSILIKGGGIIDASITPTPRKPKGSKIKDNTKKCTESTEKKPKKKFDTEASWTQKRGRAYYGYKKHYLCDKNTSLVLSVETSAASCHDSKYMEPCLKKANIPEGQEVLADKGYFGKPNEKMRPLQNVFY